ncbi:MAG: ABC transporter substrate-binding protein, partial [Acidimicrobiaceae bacterium]|nr:ABC transporter substrate-binding protein [Acidimicrobiaceae bacterium]
MLLRFWRSCRSLGAVGLTVFGLLTGLLVPAGANEAGAAPLSAGGSGGPLKVLVNSSLAWHSLDPATGTGFLAFPFYMDAIYGNLFERGPGNKVIDDLASGYKISKDGKSVTIRLRHGINFTDGTPFNAAAVKYNIERDLSKASADACGCAQNFPIASITTPDQYTAVLHLTKPFAPIIQAFFGNVPNWIASPTAIKKLGVKQFAMHPVGAGPFKVKTNSIGSVLALVKNPNYWSKGEPKANALTFSTIGSDESAYEALQAGQAQSYLRMGSVTIAQRAKKNFTVTEGPNDDPWSVQLNSTVAPFTNKLAREAIYYATNPAPINKALLQGQGVLTQSLTGPQSLFFEPKVPGYRSYNLAKAKAAVKKLGGLKVTLLAPTNPINTQILTALKAEWSQAGIQTTLDSEQLAVYINREAHNQWQAGLQSVGGLDPALGFSLSFRFLSDGPFTGVKNPALDKLINAGSSELNPERRVGTYRQAFKLISDEAY